MEDSYRDKKHKEMLRTRNARKIKGVARSARDGRNVDVNGR